MKAPSVLARSTPPGSYRRDEAGLLPGMFEPFVRCLLAFVYCVAMFFSYRALSQWWTYAGFDYRPIGLMLVPLLTAAALPALLLPRQVRSLSEFAAWILFYSLFLPAMIIPQLQGWTGGWAAGQLFFIILVSTILFLLLTRGAPRPLRLLRFDGRLFWVGLVAIWVVLHGAVILVFGGTLSLAGFEDVYEQRSTAALLLGGGGIAYVLSNAASALNPFLVATGIAERKWWRVPLGIIGQLIVYSSLAGKIVLVFPLIIAATFLLFDRHGRLHPRRIGLALAAVGLIGLPLLLTYEPSSGTFSAFVDLIYFRTLYLPGVLVGAYNDFFSIYPITYFSHSIVGRLFTEYPYGVWSVGQVVGAFVTPTVRYDQINNYNANFIAADGIAGLGVWGIPVAVVLVALTLKLIDKVLGAIDLRVRCAAFIPLVMWLSDGSLFTALLTGGGVATTLLVYLWGCTKHNEAEASASATGDARRARAAGPNKVAATAPNA